MRILNRARLLIGLGSRGSQIPNTTTISVKKSPEIPEREAQRIFFSAGGFRFGSPPCTF